MNGRCFDWHNVRKNKATGRFEETQAERAGTSRPAADAILVRMPERRRHSPPTARRAAMAAAPSAAPPARPSARVSLAAGLVALAFTLALTPDISGDKDAGEFVLVLARFGAAHPTGYPLYTLAGGVFVHLLHACGAHWAWAANAWSAVGGAVAVALLHAFAARLLAREGLPAAQASLGGLFPAAALAAHPLWTAADDAGGGPLVAPRVGAGPACWRRSRNSRRPVPRRPAGPQRPRAAGRFAPPWHGARWWAWGSRTTRPRCSSRAR